MLAALAVVASETGQTLAHSSGHVTIVAHRADLVALAGLALGESVVSLGALLTVVSREVDLARASLSALRLAVVSIGSIQVALALPAVRVAVVSIGTGVAVGRLEGGTALAVSGLLLAVSRGVEVVTLAG